MNQLLLLTMLIHNFNRIFSEIGWRSIRFEIRQIKKRQKTGRVELPKCILNDLETIKLNEQLDSISATVEFLIDTYTDHSPKVNDFKNE